MSPATDVTTTVEAERKYALAPGQQLPSLDAVAKPGPVDHFELVATYYDAPDYRLTRASKVIRRRTGGADAGWHLKLPGNGPDERLEVQAPLASARLPQQLRELVAQTLAGAPVMPVAVLRTSRRQQQLLGTDGAVLAVTCTDRVMAEVGDRTKEWWEAEVELVTGDAALMDAVEAVFGTAGIRRAEGGSKVARALDRAIALAKERAQGNQPTAGECVLNYLADQIGVLQNREAAVRTDGYDSVHRSRVATRRLRSALRTYAGVFAAGSVQHLRAELRWHAEELGAPRDAEVLKERLLAAVADLPEQDQALVAQRVDAALTAAHADAHAQLVASMATERYERLQLILEQLLASARLGRLAAEPAAVVLSPLLDKAIQRVRRLSAHAAARPTDLTRWHDVRKAAKAARYGAEALIPALGEPAQQLAATWEAVTEAFGAVQDAVVSQQVVDDLAWYAAADGLPRTPFDELHHDQDQLLREALASGRQALARALG